MRKRTYTALDGPTNYVSTWDNTLMQDVLQTQTKKSTHAIPQKVGVSSELHQSALQTPQLSIGVAKPDSLGDLKNSVTPTSTEVSSPEIDDIPLTTIHNLVGTCEIFSSIQPIDLELVYKCLPNSYYNRTRFAAITIRVTNPVCTGLLFTSGKLVVTGSKSLIECTLAALKIVRALERHILMCSFTVRNVVIQNVVRALPDLYSNPKLQIFNCKSKA